MDANVKSMNFKLIISLLKDVRIFLEEVKAMEGKIKCYIGNGTIDMK